jgi:hypothetical protein
MMKTKQSIQFFENPKLLMEIGNLKSKKNELYQEKGPSSTDYIKLSLQLDLLINEYIEEKIQFLK